MNAGSVQGPKLTFISCLTFTVLEKKISSSFCQSVFKALLLPTRCRREIIPHASLAGLGVQSVVAHHHHHQTSRSPLPVQCRVLPPCRDMPAFLGNARHCSPVAFRPRGFDRSSMGVVSVVTVYRLFLNVQRTKLYRPQRRVSDVSARSREVPTALGGRAQPCTTPERRLLATARGLRSNRVPRDPLVLPSPGIHTRRVCRGDLKLIVGCQRLY